MKRPRPTHRRRGCNWRNETTCSCRRQKKKKKGRSDIPSQYRHSNAGNPKARLLAAPELPSTPSLSHRSSFGEHVSRNVGTLENDAGTQRENLAPKKHPSRTLSEFCARAEPESDTRKQNKRENVTCKEEKVLQPLSTGVLLIHHKPARVNARGV